MPTSLPRPMKEDSTTIDIKTCFQEYQNWRGDIHERCYLQEYIFKYGFKHKKENVKSLNKNDPTCEKSKDLLCPINEEVINTFTDNMWNVWNKFRSKKDEKRIDAPLHK